MELLKRFDLVMLYSRPLFNSLDYPLEPFLKLPKRIKLIGNLRDIHCADERNERAYLSQMDEMLDRFDIILHFADEYFRSNYSKFLDKAIYVPQFFASYKRYDFEINNAPIKRILLSGAHGRYYPLRWKLYKKYRTNENIDVVKGGKYAGMKYTGDEYAKLLRRYLGVIATGGKMRYAMAKYAEIPASGALLLGQELPDVKLMGFEPWKHFIPITSSNILDRISYVINNCESLVDMREECREFVWENHGLNNRFNQIKDIIKDRL